MKKVKIYLDYNATTPCDPLVVEAMLPFFTTQYGNAASRSHAFGWAAEEAVEKAREQVAGIIHADPKEIVFTSGATEGVNLALKGIFELYQKKGNHIITAGTEHNAVLDTCNRLEKMGATITVLDVNTDGRISLEALEQAIRPDTILVSIMWANNETGVIQPMTEIGEICGRQDVLLFSDATQAVGKIPVDPRQSGIHLMAFSAHKMYGPKGVGTLYVSRSRPRVRLSPQIDGGGHEGGRRSGTLNVPGIVGFGKAAELMAHRMETEADRLRPLRDKLEQHLCELEAVQVNGHKTLRLPHVSNISFKHVDAEALMMTFHQHIAVSSGSACTSASLEPSHVLTAMGLPEELAHGSLRFSLGLYTSESEIDHTIEAVKKGVIQLRELSPVWEMYKEGVI